MSQRGEFIDLTMSIKGLERATRRTGSTMTSAQEFNMGGNALVILSEKVRPNFFFVIMSQYIR